MENPDVELVLERDAHGFITSITYKVHNREDGKAPIEFLEALHSIFGYEEEQEVEPMPIS